MKRCETLLLDLEQEAEIANFSTKRWGVQTRMTFDDTDIKITALDVATGKWVKSEIDFFKPLK